VIMAEREITLAYGSKQLRLTLPSCVQVDEFKASSVTQPVQFEQFRTEFEKSNGRSLLQCDRLLFVVNDAYRHTPTSLILDWLEQLVPGVTGRGDFMVATGSHEPPTEQQMQSIFGRHFVKFRDRISWHVATDAASMQSIGRDALRQEVLLNRAVMDHDAVVVIGSVEPHYFAGFTGGRKSIFPGLIDLATIERNHNLANSLEAMPLRLKGNPVHEHLESLMRLIDLKNVFSIQLVADSGGRIGAVSCGGLGEGFFRAVEYANTLYAREVARPYDVVLCEILSPLDKNLYQAQKGLENCQVAVADGGAAIVVSPCEEGVGSKFFYDQAASWNRERNEPEDGILRFGSHKLGRVNLMTRRIDVRVFSVLPAEIVRRVFYEPVGDLPELLKSKMAGKAEFRLAVVHDAGHTVLKLS
jgi:lactate racemase